MILFKNFEDMITSQFEQDGEKDDKGELIKSTGQPMTEEDFRLKEAILLLKAENLFVNRLINP